MVVTIETAKLELDALIERSSAGEEVLITRDGQPVARVVGIGPGVQWGSNGSETSAAVDLSPFAGSLTLREDPLEIQRQARDEWP
jgi:prevent-host-death family protein